LTARKSTQARRVDADQGEAGEPEETPCHLQREETAMYQRILVPVDGSTTSKHGLDEAIRLAKLTGARLVSSMSSTG
jgi:hypothetical protein